MRIAVIGAGIAGLGAAWTLARRYPVVLYEAEGRLGGHAHTVDITLDGEPAPVDTGFLVYNRRNYPQLDALFNHLAVQTAESDMSFSISIGNGACEYRGSLRGLAAQPSRLMDPDHWRMVVDILRFARRARSYLARGGDGSTLSAFLNRSNFSTAFRDRYLLPMAAAIWSSSLEAALKQPAKGFLRFFENHALLDVAGRPSWRSVVGGSRTYVERMAATMATEIRTGRAVVAIERKPDGVWIRDATGLIERFDNVVFATHADVTLNILAAGASNVERRILGAFPYRSNRAVLHRDTGLMPKRRAAWASWNCLAATPPHNNNPAVTYWLNALQNLTTRDQAFVTLNPLREPRDGTIEAEFRYDHPQFDAAAISAQQRLSMIQGVRRSWFCGSYCGYGFHEDGLQSGLSVAASLGALPPWRAEPASPARMIASSSLAEAAE